MKVQNIFKMSLLAAAITVFASCEKDKNDNNDNDKTYAVSGNASGSQENPAVTTTGTGTLSGTYNARTNKLDYTISWTNLSGPAVSAHFHGPAAMGTNAGIIVDITIGTTGISGSTSGSTTLSDDAETQLLNGNVYYNVHTASNPDGEIRGQVSAVVQ